MATKDFWQEREQQWQKEEERCRKLFAQHGSGNGYSYSRSEVNTLRRLKLMPEKPNNIQ